MADQAPVRLPVTQRVARHATERRSAVRQHTPVNLVSHVNLIPLVGQSPPARWPVTADPPGDLGHDDEPLPDTRAPG
jgi:hypothetical protein